VYGVPETFFIDRKGRVRFKQVGALTDELARQRLDTLLKEPS
jgi:cytochrome c biogenesis protein CcmG/thiol:disulfide interchange protein DsbE